MSHHLGRWACVACKARGERREAQFRALLVDGSVRSLCKPDLERRAAAVRSYELYFDDADRLPLVGTALSAGGPEAPSAPETPPAGAGCHATTKAGSPCRRPVLTLEQLDRWVDFMRPHLAPYVGRYCTRHGYARLEADLVQAGDSIERVQREGMAAWNAQKAGVTLRA